jgi:hypothetical protein
MLKKQDGFTLVAKQRPEQDRASALYYYLSTFGVELIIKHPAIIAYSPPTAIRDAFIFNLELNKTTDLFVQQGYALVERHFRIDKTFTKMQKASKDLLSQWHYTATYSKPGQDEPLTLHVYFHHGIKLLATMRIANGEIMNLNSSQGCLAREDANIALTIVLELIKVVSNRHEQLEADFEAKSNKISSIEYVLSLTPKKLNEEVSNCAAVAHELTMYQEEIIDNRFKFLHNRVDDIIKINNIKIQQKLKAAEPVEMIQTESVKVLQQPKKSEPALNSKLKLIEEMKIIEKDLSSFLREFHEAKTAVNILQLEKQRQAIKDRLLFAYFDMDSEQSFEKRILKLEKILDGTKTLYDKFTELALACDFIQTQELYPHVACLIPSSFYYKLIATYTSPLQKKGTEIAQVEICKFLFANSDGYRVLISLFSHMMRGCLAENNVKLLFATSFLLGVIAAKREELFKTLLIQCDMSYLPGARIGDSMISLLDLTCTIADSLPFIKILLAQGAVVDPIESLIASEIFKINSASNFGAQMGVSAKDIQNLKAYASVNWKEVMQSTAKVSHDTLATDLMNISDAEIANYKHQTTKRYKEILAAGCTLARYIEFGEVKVEGVAKKLDAQLMRQFAIDTSTDDLFGALARFSLAYINIIMLPTRDKIGIELQRTSEDRQRRVSTLQFESAQYFSFLMGSERPGQFERLKSLVDILQLQIRSLTNSRLMNFVQLSDAKELSFLSAGDIYNLIIAKRAKLFALAYCKPSLEVHKKIIMTHHELITLWENAEDHRFTSEMKQQQAYICRLAIQNILTTSIFKDELDGCIVASQSTQDATNRIGTAARFGM